jgi:hypothetical protein
MLRKVGGLKNDEVTEDWRKLHTWSILIFAPLQVLLKRCNEGG